MSRCILIVSAYDSTIILNTYNTYNEMRTYMFLT